MAFRSASFAAETANCCSALRDACGHLREELAISPTKGTRDAAAYSSALGPGFDGFWRTLVSS